MLDNGRDYANFRAKRGIWVERSATSEPYSRELYDPSEVILQDNGTRAQRGEVATGDRVFKTRFYFFRLALKLDESPW